MIKLIKFDNLLICLAVLTCLITQAASGDPLNPGMLGETMDMPLPPDLVAKAVKAGVIKSSSEVTGSLPSAGQPMSLGTPTAGYNYAAEAGNGISAAGTAGPIDTGPASSQPSSSEMDIGGTLSLVLRDSVTRYLNLALQQSGNAISGQGNITAGGSPEAVIAEGLVDGGSVNLTVASLEGSDIYRLDLLAEDNILKGSYAMQSEGDVTTTGEAVGIMPNAGAGAVGPASQPSNEGLSVGGTGASSGVSAQAGPVALGSQGGSGRSFSSSKSISMSASGGGSMVSSTSSTSF